MQCHANLEQIPGSQNLARLSPARKRAFRGRLHRIRPAQSESISEPGCRGSTELRCPSPETSHKRYQALCSEIVPYRKLTQASPDEAPESCCPKSKSLPLDRALRAWY